MGWDGKLVSMELDDDDKIDRAIPEMSSKPDFPWGLRVSLTEKELEKLDLDCDCDVGDTIDLRAVAVVTSVSKSKMDDGKETVRVELQIQELGTDE